MLHVTSVTTNFIVRNMSFSLGLLLTNFSQIYDSFDSRHNKSCGGEVERVMTGDEGTDMNWLHRSLRALKNT